MSKPGAGDRRFAAIYAAIKDYDYRHAMALCERREVANLPLAKALKATVLMRSGHRDDAVSIATALAREKPTDMAVLRALASVFKQSGDSGWFVQIFDVAAELKPTDAATLRQLCFAFLHVEDYGKMQKTALRLLKLTAEPQYACWAAVAVHAAASLPAEVSPEPAPNAVTGGGRGWGWAPPAPGDRSLVVAQAMLARALDGAPAGDRDSESVGLWALTMVRQGLAAEALAAVEAPGGKYSATLAPATAPLLDDGDAAADAAAAEAAAAEAADEAALLELSLDEEVAEFADGRGGRGRSPGQLLPGDHARLVAFLATEAAVAAGRGSGAAAVAARRACWLRARDAHEALLRRDDGAGGGGGDWAVTCGAAYCAAQLLVADAAAFAGAGSDAVAATDALRQWAVGAGDAGVETASAAAADGVAPDGGRSRGSALARVLAAAVRVEFATRLRARAPAIAEVIDATAGAGACGAAADGAPFVAALARSVSAIAHKSSAFSDVKLFLAPLQPPAPVEAPAAAAAESPAAVTDALGGFLSADARILAVPFAPIAAVGSAGDVAPLTPLFRWSFTVAPDAAAGGGVYGVACRLREACRPTDADAAAWRAMTAAARDAASARDAAAPRKSAPGGGRVGATAAAAIAADDDEEEEDAAVVVTASGGGGGGGKKKKGGKAKGGSKAGRAAAVAAGGKPAVADAPAAEVPPAQSDPHGVAAVLDPLQALLLTAEQVAAVARARDGVRRYSTGMQLLRHLGFLSPRGKRSPGAAVVRAAVDELMTAWGAALDLAPLCGADAREALEGDELPLLAAHMLAELGFEELEAAAASQDAATPEAGASGSDAGDASDDATRRRDAAWRYFVEAAAVLAMASAASPGNGQIELACARSQAWLGNASGVFDRWRKARVRHIMLDSLGHLLTPTVTRMGWVQTMTGAGCEVTDFHRSSAGLHAEYAVGALRGGHYGAALDVMRLRLRLRESATFARARSAAAYVCVVAGGRTLPEAQAQLRRVVLTGEVPEAWVEATPGALARLRDNDDRDVFQCWDPPAPALLEELRGVGGRGAHSAAVAHALARGGVHAAAVAAFGAPAAASGAGWARAATLLAGGVTGGVAERAVRRALLGTTIGVRAAVHAALLHGGDGALPALDADLSRLRPLLMSAGLLPCDGRGGGCDGGGGVPHTHAVIGEVVSGALVGPDTGGVAIRDAVHRGCAAALVDSLDALRECVVGSVAGASGGGDAAAAAAAMDAAAAAATALLRRTADGVAAQCAAIAAAVRVAVVAPSAAAAAAKERGSAVAGGGAGARGPAVRHAHLALTVPAEAALLLTHTMPYVALALATAGAALQAARQRAAAQAGGGKGSKATRAAPDDAPRTAVAAALRKAVDAVVAALGALRTRLGDLRDAMARPPADLRDGLLGVAASGGGPAAFVTRAAADSLRASAASSAAPSAADAPPPTGGDAYVAHLGRLREEALRQWPRWLADRLVGTCRSSLELLDEQVDLRVSLLRGVRID